ncbi:MAG: bifunctional phosphopantothenoylcysteine decarboxylase/phosphopantothenate--cysteine ligase CoaBC, partial [Candidatus Heimdallarchaeota archaeon]|nr:bifunctional phosphopantothenoylcysteine decarboxylase/phosphopantothenate--cysteine ligase CoaBC [Candidatus Heimdallarchaeota archaeon]
MNKDLEVELIGDYLKDKRIALCVTGGIASIETPKLARHLRRYGADVSTYMSDSASKFIGECSLEWGTGKKVLRELSGQSEHIAPYDLVLVSPATLNTIGKFANGIADNCITSLLASSLGSKKPIIFTPTMHESMSNNPIYKDNVKRLTDYGVKFIEPRISEGKKKIPRLETIAANVCREVSCDSLKGRKVLVTGGPTPVEIDDVRFITTLFSGGLGVEIAKDAYFRGADVKLLRSKLGSIVPEYIPTSYHKNYDEYFANVFGNLDAGYETGVFTAAVADYRPKTKVSGKIPSQGALKTIELTETAKIIKRVREEYPELFMVTFKYECQVTKEKLLG